jgi:hypothetical protein
VRGATRPLLSPRIYKNGVLQTASEAVSPPINDCTAQPSGQMPTLEVKTCSLFESGSLLVMSTGNLAEGSTIFAPMIEFLAEGSTIFAPMIEFLAEGSIQQ